jgi:hypothetical protein
LRCHDEYENEFGFRSRNNLCLDIYTLYVVCVHQNSVDIILSHFDESKWNNLATESSERVPATLHYYV